VGHARTYLYFDIVRRYLQAEGVAVRHVMNIMDFEDTVTARAKELRTTWSSLARRVESAFIADWNRLGILRPHVMPQASAHVPQMIRVIRRLERLGRIYRTGNQWMFRAPSRPDKRNFPVGEALAEHAVPESDPSVVAQRPTDREFMVWHRQEPPAPSLSSPWGKGVPGWHVECFAMAEKFLGLPIDLHGGGIDLIYPHHYAENEIALALQGRPFARRFLHTAFVTGAGEKMSKRTGNLIELHRALEEYGPGALRAYLLSQPYNRRLDWRPADFRRIASALTILRERCRKSIPNGGGGSLPVSSLTAVRTRIYREVGNGLRVDRGLEALFDWGEEIGHAKGGKFPRGSRREIRDEYGRVECLLGFSLMGTEGTGLPESTSFGAPGSR
jgi:cysteinyl-tRNA synthetase